MGYSNLPFPKDKKSIFSSKVDQEDFLTWKRRADKGIIEAQIQTGWCYENGKGIDQSYKLAFHYYKLAADKGKKSTSSSVIS